jgi:putative protein-disulfide isomerase
VLAIALLYVTDPACPSSWAAEPAIRATARRGELRLVMAGRARETDPLTELRAWLDAGAESNQPVDGRLWLEDPPRSTYPACLAVKAAAEQGRDADYLRLAREGFAVRRRRLDRPEALIDLAREVPGLDVERFRIDLQSNAIVEAFGADLDVARGGPVPRIEVDGEVAAPHEVRRLLERAEPVGIEEALRTYPNMTTPEVAEVCDLPGPRAPAELWRLALEFRARHHNHLWSLG